MSLTTGWDPWETLTRIYWVGVPDIDEDQRRQAKTVIEIASNSFTHLDYKDLMETGGPMAVFLRLREERRGKKFPKKGNHVLLKGLLECLKEKMLTPKFPLLGIYDHFKGGVYLAQGVSRWASGDGERVVEYISIPKCQKFTRLASQWCEVVQWPDGKFRSRFVHRGHPNKEPEVPAFKVSI